LTESYIYEKVPVCFGDRVWELETWPVTDWSDVTYLPEAFDNEPAILDNGGPTGDFVLMDAFVEAYSIEFFPQELI
jgi:hypothetical protein